MMATLWLTPRLTSMTVTESGTRPVGAARVMLAKNAKIPRRVAERTEQRTFVSPRPPDYDHAQSSLTGPR